MANDEYDTLLQKLIGMYLERQDGIDPTDADREQLAQIARQKVAGLEQQEATSEAERLRAIDAEELAKLKTLPRGPNSARARAHVQAEAQTQRYGPRPEDPSLKALREKRESRQLVIPDGDQATLMSLYIKEVSKVRGQLSLVSELQRKFRAKGLKV